VIELDDFYLLLLFVENIDDGSCGVIYLLRQEIIELLLFLLVSKVKSFSGFHVAKVIKITLASLINYLVSEECGI
jgi:hypothetical protein